MSALLWMAVIASRANGSPAPPERATLVLVRALAYDRALGRRAGDLHIGVLDMTSGDYSSTADRAIDSASSRSPARARIGARIDRHDASDSMSSSAAAASAIREKASASSSRP